MEVQQVKGPSSGTQFEVGTTDVEFNATDASGNFVSCSFTVSVIDNEAPVVTHCPSDIRVVPHQMETQPSGIYATKVTWVKPTATDNAMPRTGPNWSGGVETASCNIDGTCYDYLIAGVTSLNYTATDTWGNTATCNFSVTVVPTGLSYFKQYVLSSYFVSIRNP